ncbi:Spy0128 family protein [Bifidobacterium pseudolongum]|uniref:VWA domain-containing protein n=1 Tax=Bifidobacterium pseudolongum subsp. globosum TaxID=1690 RepID=A0AB37X0Q9_9BIFI|nr:FctA domain-containing protein [Bifidobacterium pseudolongum]RYQ36371.1 VWA domain-containing protein [Bifidobacterium pseudolongum subsp. globosum]
MRGPKRLLARHGAQADEERNGRTPVRKLVATFCAVAMSVGMAGVSMSAYADDQQPAEDATTTVEATPEAQPTEDATVDAQPEAEATDAAQDAAADTSETTTESADAAQTMPETASDQNDEVVPPVMRAAPAVVADTKPAPPTGTKYITSNPNRDNDYTLHVALTGSNETGTTQATPVNVAFVLDSSGSMQGNRWQIATNAIKTMSQKFLKENQDNRVAVIRYASTLGKTTPFTNSMTDINNVLSNGPDGGTNWEAGLQAANALKPTTGAKKYIIFISDGQPTYRLSAMGCSTSSWKPECAYHWWNKIWGEGNADTNELNLLAAVNEANKRGNVPLYAVRVDTDTTTVSSMNAFAEKTNAVTRASYDGTSETALNKAFNEIYQSITTSAQTKILTLTDTLSEWVTPTQWDPTVTGDVTQFVKVKGPDPDGVDPDGVDLPTTAYSAEYNADTRTVTVTFENGGVIATASQTYTMRFDVAPSQQAFDQWASNANSGKNLYDVNGITSTGGANTGETSTGQPGFVSNAGASASYQVCTTTTTSTATPTTECDDTQEYKAYQTPVVQTKFTDATEDGLGVQKTVNGSKGWDVNDTFQFTIAKAAETPDNTPLPQDTTLTVSTKAGSNTATGKFGQITYNTPGTYRYTVSEVKGKGPYQYSQAAYLVTVKVTANGSSKSLVAAIDSVQQTKDDWGADRNVTSQMPMAFVNQNDMVTLAGTIGVKKTVNGTDTDQDFAFTMTATGDNAGDVKWPNAGQASSTLQITDPFTNGEPKEAKFAGALEFPVPSSNTETATYTLQVTEDSADNPPAGWNYDNSVKTVTVTVQYDTTQNTWIATATPAIVEFTNTWVAVSNLPLTGEGGATPRLWLAIGGGLGALALLAAGGAAIWRKRRLI